MSRRGPSTAARRWSGEPVCRATRVIRKLEAGAEERLAGVLAWTFDDSAKVLGYTVVSRDSTKDGAYLRTMATGSTVTLLAGRGDFKGIALDRAAKQGAVLS